MKTSDPALTIQGLLTRDVRQWLLRGLRYPVLAVNASGRPPSQSVMWFDLEETHTIVMNTSVQRLKYRQLMRDARASLLFEDEMHWVAIQGAVELDADHDRALECIKRLAKRYGTDPQRFEGQQRVTIRLQVDRVIRHD